jgi:chromosome segregation ATPase
MNCREQSQITAAFEELQARGDLFTKKLVNEKRRLSRLEAEIEDLDTEIARQREENKSLAVRVFNTHSIKASNDVTAQQRVDGVDPARLAEINQQKVVNNLEERLDKALIRKNTIESENIKIKEKIDNLRRKVVNDVAAKRDMEEKLDKIKYEIGEITKKHTTASEKRDKIAEAQKQLIKDNEGEIKKFNEACASMNTYIQEQNELLEASIARVASDVVSKLEVIDSFHPRELDHSESPDVDQLDRRLAELEHQLAQKKDPANPTEGAVKYDAESLKRLLETSGLHSTEDMIDFFMKEEDSLFSLFNYIQAVNQDCDRMLKEKAIVDRKMEQLEERMLRKETERKSFVDKYNRQLNEVRLDKERFKDQNEQRKTAVIHIARNIQELYDKLQCHNIDSKSPCILDQAPIQDQAIMSEDITSLEQQVSESNVLHQMEVIEQRAIQIIYEYAKKFDDQKNYRDARLLLVRFLDVLFVG